MRYEAYGWHVQVVEDGDSADVSAMRTAVKAAQEVTDRPSIIKINTTIGFGAVKQGTAGVHGAPIGDEDIAKLKEEWGFDPAAKFFVDSEVRRATASAPRLRVWRGSGKPVLAAVWKSNLRSLPFAGCGCLWKLSR
jgi:transketolase